VLFKGTETDETLASQTNFADTSATALYLISAEISPSHHLALPPLPKLGHFDRDGNTYPLS